jgi:hypothetical protein
VDESNFELLIVQTSFQNSFVYKKLGRGHCKML